MSKTKQWVALATAAVLTVLGLGWFLVISPVRSEAADLAVLAEEQRGATGVLATQLRVLQAQAADLPAEKARLAELQRQLPATVALPELVRMLTAAGDETGVEIVSMAPGAPVPTGSYSEVPYTLVVTGGYFNLQQFLGALEDLPRAFLVADFSLTPGATGGSELQMSLNGKVFTTEAVEADGAGAGAGAGAGSAAAGAGAGAGPAGQVATDLSS